MSNPPPDAEEIEIGPFWITERAPSKFLPGQTAIVPKIICPSCKTRHPSTCKPFTCECGLSMQMDVGVLRIWKREMIVNRECPVHGSKKEPAL